MGKESVVEIKSGKYRYVYNEQTRATEYLGPVGNSPPLSEAEFLKIVAIALPQHAELADALEKNLITLKPKFVDLEEDWEVEVDSEDDVTTVEGEYGMRNLHGRIRIDIDDYEGNRDIHVHVHEVDTEFVEDIVYESIDKSFPMTMSTDEIVAKVMDIIREESSLV